MRTLIQRIGTHLFFNLDKKEWMPSRQKATAFSSASEALQICLRAGLTNVQLVMQDGRNSDFAIAFP